MKDRFLLGFTTIFLGSIFLIVVALLFIGDIALVNLRFSTQFESDQKALDTGQYLMDDFDSYKNTQRVNLNGQNDFSEFSSKGMIVGWADVKDYSQIQSIDLDLSDASSNYTIKGIYNKPDLERLANGIWTDDDFVDYPFKSGEGNPVWRDYMLINGENLVLWEWNGPVPLNMNQVTVKTSYPIRDAFIITGFSENESPTGGNWISPHGLIQYGFQWIENGSLFMKNVRQAQMVSNGDHARIISKMLTPKDFIMRVQFTPLNLPDKPSKNDYIRIAWDFENEWDTGHDQSLVYITDEYGYIGLQRVYPVVRQKEQAFENSPKKSFRLRNNRTYEVDVRVTGQTARATVYERRFGMLWKKASLEYTFQKPRAAESYPFSIEATGNPNLKVDFVEVREIIK